MSRPTDAQLIAMLDKAAWIIDDLFELVTMIESEFEDYWTEHERQYYQTLVADYRAAANALRSEILPPEMVERAGDRKSTRLNSSHVSESRMPSSA